MTESEYKECPDCPKCGHQQGFLDLYDGAFHGAMITTKCSQCETKTTWDCLMVFKVSNLQHDEHELHEFLGPEELKSS